MCVAVIVTGVSKSFLTKIGEEGNFYWGIEEGEAFQFDNGEDALEAARSSIPSYLWCNIAIE